MAYVPTRPDATPCAADAATRFSTATGQTVIPVDTLVALLDSMLCSVGYQVQSDAAATVQSTVANGSFADVPGYSSWTVSVPVAKTYLLHADLFHFCSVIAGGYDTVFYQVVVDGVAQTPLNSMHTDFNTANLNVRSSFRQPLALAAGSHVIKLQWKGTTGTTMNTNTNGFRNMTLVG